MWIPIQTEYRGMTNQLCNAISCQTSDCFEVKGIHENP